MATVVIGCKLPNGLALDLPGKARVIVAGTNSAALVGGHGITRDVDAAFWAEWKKVHKGFQPLEDGLIFAYNDEATTQAAAIERSEEKSGFEPIDPNKPGAGLTPEPRVGE